MFYCQATNKLVPAGESAHKLVTHVRPKNYVRRNHKTNQDDIIGQGFEIVREILVCKEYHAEMVAKGFVPTLVRDKE